MSATLLLALAVAADAPPPVPTSLFRPLAFRRPASLPPQDEEAAEEAPPTFVGFEWAGSVSAGLTVAGGNTRSSTASLSLDAEGNAEKSRVKLGASYIGGRTKNRDPGAPDDGDWQTTARSLTGEGKYDYFLNDARSTYAYTNALAITDGVRELDLLWSAGVGLGYQFFDKKEMSFLFFGERKQSFRGEVGLAYTDEDYAGSAADTDYIAARAYVRYDVALSETSSAFTEVEWIPSLEDIDEDQIYRSKSGLRANISGNLNAEGTMVLNYDTSPAFDSAGMRFQRLDVLYIFGLNWTF